MFISKAYAAAAETAGSATMSGVTAAPGVLATPPSATEAFLWNMGLILLLVVMFYVLLILPQQRRFKEHGAMLSGLKKGDKVVTGGGFVGTIENILNDSEVLIDLGGGVKVTALRSSLQGRSEPPLKTRPANDQKNKNQKNKG
jgi:preprotein translocase subunit YajC